MVFFFKFLGESVLLSNYTAGEPVICLYLNGITWMAPDFQPSTMQYVYLEK